MIYRFVIVTLMFCCVFQNQALASNKPTQFNFDDNYGGEEIAGNKNDQLIYDPFENFNRKIFAFNEVLDKNIALPAVKSYRRFVPKMVRNSVRNFINNIEAPLSIVNSLLQGDGTNSMASLSSFLINTTLGVGGLFDVAGSKKITYKKEDLGQTLGKYGIKPGPYLVIPLAGPSDVRDFSGYTIEKLVSPLSFNSLNIDGSKDWISNDQAIALSVMKGADAREGLIEIVDDVRKNSFDIYAAIRSGYLQRRGSLISNK